MAMSNEEKSELLFGNYDEQKMDGPIQWHPVINKLFWSV